MSDLWLGILIGAGAGVYLSVWVLICREIPRRDLTLEPGWHVWAVAAIWPFVLLWILIEQALGKKPKA